MSRSTWKGPFTDPILLKKPIRVWSRSSTILPIHVGKTYEIHNGRNFIKKVSYAISY